MGCWWIPTSRNASSWAKAAENSGNANPAQVFVLVRRNRGTEWFFVDIQQIVALATLSAFVDFAVASVVLAAGETREIEFVFEAK